MELTNNFIHLYAVSLDGKNVVDHCYPPNTPKSVIDRFLDGSYHGIMRSMESVHPYYLTVKEF